MNLICLTTYIRERVECLRTGTHSLKYLNPEILIYLNTLRPIPVDRLETPESTRGTSN